MQIVSKELSFSYNPKATFSRQALDSVTLTIESGEFFGIIGETGSGKSTFIQHLNGLISVQKGSLTVGEFDLSAGVKRKKKEFKKSLKELRRKVGMVFQYPEYQLFAETVFDDVAFAVKNFFPNLNKEEVAAKVKRAVEIVGLNFEEVYLKSPFDLSGGQKRRVAIAGVLAGEPEVLVLDEPVAGLDPVGKKRLMSLLHTLHENGTVKTIIIVSHDMDEISENVERLAVFSGGKVVKTCTPKELFSDPSGEAIERLGLPVTAYATCELKKIGVNIDSDFKAENFISEVVKEYKKLG